MSSDAWPEPVSQVRAKRSLPVIGSAPELEAPRPLERVLRTLERPWRAFESLFTAGLRPELDPFAEAGGVTTTLFVIACASGVLLLVWYETSVHHAYQSVAAMGASPWSAGLVRSLHRYSSDGCVLFALIHALRLFLGRRFDGPRWLSWVSGVLAVGLLWLVGWLGYWLVWDERAREVAVGSARLLDSLPIFAEPLSRSFLSDDALSSLLFFVVVFLHMLVPLVMGVALWLHVARLSRPRFFARRALTCWLVGSLLLVSVLAPADVAGPARMAVVPQELVLDGWYLLPIALLDRLQSGTLWALGLLSGAFVFSVPWLLRLPRAGAARVIPSRCTACERCVADCPYDAIRMVPRSDGRAYPAVAVVDADRCVGCGICAGSCDSAGVGLPWFDAVSERLRLDRALEAALRSVPAPKLAFVCREARPPAGLASHHSVLVPCAGWVHPLLAERASKHGAAEITIVGCSPGECRYREGARWTEQRLDGQRLPRLRTEKLPRGSVTLVTRSAGPLRRASGAAGMAVAFAALTYAGSQVSYRQQERPAELVVSLKHAGALLNGCREPRPEEIRGLPEHMRPRQICERGRAEVKLRVSVDGRERLVRAYPPGGLWADASSTAIEPIELAPGEHQVRVEIGDDGGGGYRHVSERVVPAAPGQRQVVSFQRDRFAWTIAPQSAR